MQRDICYNDLRMNVRSYLMKCRNLYNLLGQYYYYVTHFRVIRAKGCELHLLVFFFTRPIINLKLQGDVGYAFY